MSKRGGGNYDDEIILLQRDLKADGIILIVINGKKGNGFGVRVEDKYLPMIADVLQAAINDLKHGNEWLDTMRVDEVTE